MVRYEIKVLSANGLKRKDILTFSSDPFCKVTVNGHTQQTRTIYKTINPVWNETFIFDCPPSSVAVFHVYDYDTFTNNDSLGQATFPLSNVYPGQICNQNLPLSKKGVICVQIRMLDGGMTGYGVPPPMPGYGGYAVPPPMPGYVPYGVPATPMYSPYAAPPPPMGGYPQPGVYPPPGGYPYY